MKPGDTYISKDGRELTAVKGAARRCADRDGYHCEVRGVCSHLHTSAWPCGNQPIIFVNKEEYLTHKLLGTKQSSS